MVKKLTTHVALTVKDVKMLKMTYKVKWRHGFDEREFNSQEEAYLDLLTGITQTFKTSPSKYKLVEFREVGKAYVLSAEGAVIDSGEVFYIKQEN
jgi:hypothetical protein